MSKKEELVKRLEDPSPEVRRRASRQLATLPSEESIDLILSAISDEDWRVRKETIAMLQEIAPSETLINHLVEGLIQEDNIGLRNAAAEAMAEMGAPAVNALLKRMPKLAPGGRKISLEVIGRSGDEKALHTLISSLKDPDNNVRVCAAELLSEQGSVEAQAALIGCLGNKDFLLTLAALQSLNQISAKIPWAVLEPLVGQEIYGSEILLAVGRTGEPQAADHIVSQLVKEVTAARSLEMLHTASPEAAAAVRKALEESDEKVLESLKSMSLSGCGGDQRAAVKCLLWTRNENCISTVVELAHNESIYPLLLEYLENWGEVVIEELQAQLPRLTGRSLASVVSLLARLMSTDAGRANAALFSAYLNSNDIVVATAAAGAVGRFGDETVIDRLIEMAGAEHPRVRRSAGHALMELAKNHSEAVRNKLKQVEFEGLKGIELCRVLGSVGKPEDVGLLASTLSSPEPELRRAALKPLATIAKAGALESLSLAMTDEDTGVQMAAAAALSQIGPAASETIVSALRTAKGPLKTALVTALGEVGHMEAAAILGGMFAGSTDVAMAALEAMRKLALPLGEMQEEILAQDAEVVKKALLFLGPAVSKLELFKLLSHDAWDVRLAAVERLSLSQDDPSVVEQLQNRLDMEKDDLVRLSIERMLTHYKGTR